MARPDSAPRRGGCLALLGILLIEIAVGAGVTYGGYRLFFGLFDALGWTGERDFAAVCAVCLGLVAAVWPVIRIDRWGKRVTGASALDTFDMSWLP